MSDDRHPDDRPEAADAEDRYVADLLADLTEDDFRLDEPPGDLWDRIAASVTDAPEAPPLTAAEAPAPTPAPVVPLRTRRWRSVALVAAAIVTVAVLAAAIVRLARPTGPGGEVAGRARLTSEGLPTTNDLVGEAALVDVSGRREIDLDLPGLPAASDAFYELWLLAPDGTRLQSLGPTDGHGRYLVPTGIDPQAFPVVDVSREPPDGNPAHSGDSLVRGTLELS